MDQERIVTLRTTRLQSLECSRMREPRNHGKDGERNRWLSRHTAGFRRRWRGDFKTFTAMRFPSRIEITPLTPNSDPDVAACCKHALGRKRGTGPSLSTAYYSRWIWLGSVPGVGTKAGKH